MAGTTGVALVGAGYWGARLARTLAAADGCELVAVCDVDTTRAREVARAHGGVATSSSTVVMFDDTIDAVVIATPSTTHDALVTDALDAGRHVLVEKPLAATPDAVARLGARAAADGLVAMCDQTYRFAPAVSSVRAALADPTFGTLGSVESTRTNQGHSQPDLDVFWDLAYHDLAIIDTVAPMGLQGRFEVRATAGDLAGLRRPHRGHLTLDPVDGPARPAARITVDWHAETKVRSMRFSSAEHAVTWDDADGPEVQRDGEPLAVGGGEPLAAVVAEFLAAIHAGRPASCGPPQELTVLTVLEAASASAARDGEPLVVDLASTLSPRGDPMTDLAGARVLITGGAGVVGSTLVDALAPLGLDEIIVFDDFSRGLHENLADAEANADAPLTVVEGDVRDRDALAHSMAGVDVVFHEAAIRLPHCAKDPRLALEVMVDGTFNVVEAAHAAGVRRFVAASSASVYGSATTFPITEEHDPYGNRTLYGAAKVFGEQLYRSYHEMFGFDYVALRYFNVYGPRMDAHTAYTEVLIRWMQRIDDGLPPLIHGAGDQTMDFVYVTDIARANVLAATASASDEVYNIATGVETSLVELAALLHAMGSELDVEFGPDRDVPAVDRRLAATDRAARDLGFTAQVDLAEGLAGLVAWWRTGNHG